MRTEMRIERMRPLIIGHAMDNLTGVVEIDCAAWMTAFPELTRYTLAVTPPDGTPYFVPAEMEGTILRWIVRREDTAKAGEGSYQIICTGDNGEQKSTDFYPLYIYRNMPGLDGSDETPPEAALAWVSKVLDAADRAEEAARRAENAGGSGGTGGAVNSVNGKTGAVELDAEDVGARPDTWVPTPEEIGAQPAGDYALKDEIPSVPVQSVNGKTGAVQLAAADVGAADAKETVQALGTLSEEKADQFTVGEGLQMSAERVLSAHESEAVLVDTITVEEDVAEITLNYEPDGTRYNFSSVALRVTFPACSYTNNVQVIFWIDGDWRKALVSYLLNPYNGSNTRYGYTKARLDDGRWRNGWWTCVNGLGDVANYYENPYLLDEYSVEDGYIRTIKMRHATAIPAGTIIEVLGVRV